MDPSRLDVQLPLATVVASTDDAIITSLSGTITSWPRAAERIFGYTEAEAVGQSLHLIVLPERHKKDEEILGRIQGRRARRAL